MDGYVSKPVRSRELHQSIEALFVAEPDEERPPERLDREPVPEIDWDSILEAMDGNVDILRVVVQQAMDEFPDLMGQLEEAVARVDAERVARVAHTIKGSVRLFGAVEAATLAAEMEQLGTAGLLTDTKSVLERLQVEMRQLCAKLKKFLDSEADDSDSN
jgi:HPt (histidine-containing phosphotransfer) domain-containing protein